jgi:hypothetical protein
LGTEAQLHDPKEPEGKKHGQNFLGKVGEI